MIYGNYHMKIILISQLINSNDYYIALQLIVFTSSYFEMRDKLI